eukprot:CAMPEP_0113307452 /NCGR_PEP_ID=MMETSP0010_2-20120614/6290_1 /TAXON_ID=216773 ORGANISM="Corethron hystrix, Strain 308" /NCGR_SAMPLE_ID=MMETSP0010_2 /ASSEMBLY_ACC=CAM_ASM_000155 /LENGTH=118 /DNA_ID=CAMNT_0000162307 /DNA_START=178 /DNA_END=534 /DNA_ORIENTATION=- /assembly_acc=CAM_ASM_000155
MKYAYYRAAEDVIKKGMEEIDRDAQELLQESMRIAREHAIEHGRKLDSIAPLTAKQAEDLQRHYESEAHRIEFSEEYDMLEHMRMDGQAELAAKIKFQNARRRREVEEEMRIWKEKRI